jgi:6-phosphogluconolactonase
MPLDVRFYPSMLALNQAVCDHIVDIAERAITTRGRFTLALSGGSTPKPIYELLASRDYADTMNWTFVHVFWGDERCVPPTHRDSNYHMAREVLLNRVKIPLANLHRIQGETEPEKSAALYDAELRDFFIKRMNSSRPRFDLILLGMGADGHTASLFPQTPAIHETQRWTMAQYIEKLGSWRITLTPTVINAAANVFFVVTGDDKAQTVRRVLNDPYNPDELPAQIVKPTDGVLRWYLDSGAGHALQDHSIVQAE